MVGAGTKRKRRARANAVAEEVDDRRRQAAVEKKQLGVEILRETPGDSIFTEDRVGENRHAIKQLDRSQFIEQRRAAKRARRNAPKERKSEVGCTTTGAAWKEGELNGKKKNGPIAAVEKSILERKHFDKPEGHVGNRSSVLRQAKKHTTGKEDLWTSATSEVVKKEIGLNRRRLVEKTNASRKEATSVIHPSNGLSINPSYEDHQDKLGEALARIVTKDDATAWVDQRMSYDPALLEESTEGEFGDTGMKVDSGADDGANEETEEEAPVFRGAPERKTRSQRHKETRKREMVANIARKKADKRTTKDFENIEDVSKVAEAAAEKLHGITKQRMLEENPLPTPSADEPVLKRIAGRNVRNEKEMDPFVLSSELGKGMRDVKMPRANPVLRDRYLSYERRGIIAAPKVIKKELWRMQKERQADLMRDKRKRKGRGSRSNLTFWKNGKSVIL